MTRRANMPDRIGLLPSHVAAKYLTRGVQSGQEVPPKAAVQQDSRLFDSDAVRWRVGPLRDLLDEAMRRFDEVRHTAADAWLAPRLHATLRMTRAEAADPALWNFLALAVAPDYVVWRHKGAPDEEGNPKVAAVSRFVGPHYTQAFSRLWWAAELFRDGDSYKPAETACGDQAMFNTALRMDVVDHRPTAQALVACLEGMRAAKESAITDRVEALAKAVNSAGVTLVYELLAEDTLPEPDAVQGWIDDRETAAEVPWDALPEGPGDGRVRRESVELLQALFEEIRVQAPLRKRKDDVPDAPEQAPAKVSMVKTYVS